MRNQIITGLDLGTSHIRIAVCQRGEENSNSLQIIGLAEFPTQGISKGIITSIEDTVSSITAALEQVEKITGLSVENCFVGVSGSHISANLGKGVVAVSRVNGEIEEEDVSRAIEAARSVGIPPNKEILHIIPKSFIVDGQSAIKDPLGMTGIRLEVETMIIEGASSQIKNLTKCVYRTGLNIEDLIYTALGASEAVLTPRQKELGVAIVDIGASNTNLAVFEAGELIHTAVLPIGSDHITADIAIGLRIDLDSAEKIKRKSGCAASSDIDKKEEINLADYGIEDNISVSRKYLARIIEARVEEIFEKVNVELQKIERAGMLPAGAVLTGGGAKLAGLVDQAKQNLRLPARIGRIEKAESVLDKTQDPSFATSIGLAIWGNQMMEGHEDRGFDLRNLKDGIKRFGKWLKSLRP
ncbi:cell division protein FtsA [Candidatus Falkowbacteria bacterium RBG_13_39_14]|uniref:Cell division protein FtsA n=1 Tax=Candidatus Falkowbacteria bacterium RBG_13_39_14 TaxID=1797985 RepID=A0A1F5S837_9BACT|nr:MAG: cell division protein FtsA [Candidatus Falkowbacteria bacterium RBG_13_39_14]